MLFCRLLTSAALFAGCSLASLSALAADLVLDGAAAGPAICPDGGTPVTSACQVSATPAANNGCRYGGELTFGTVSLTNGAVVCVQPYDGLDPVSTGNLVLRADSITIDATSRITAKGSGYRGIMCGDGEGPVPFSGG